MQENVFMKICYLSLSTWRVCGTSAMTTESAMSPDWAGQKLCALREVRPALLPVVLSQHHGQATASVIAPRSEFWRSISCIWGPLPQPKCQLQGRSSPQPQRGERPWSQSPLPSWLPPVHCFLQANRIRGPGTLPHRVLYHSSRRDYCSCWQPWEECNRFHLFCLSVCLSLLCQGEAGQNWEFYSSP